VPLTAAVGRKLAWLVASFLFLLFHSFTKPTVAGLLFVLLMSISTGYLVYIGTSVRAVALLHAMVNAVPTTIVLIARAVAP
jgi:membrane protease YdiL (CAAX protease family)